MTRIKNLDPLGVTEMAAADRVVVFDDDADQTMQATRSAFGQALTQELVSGTDVRVFGVKGDAVVSNGVLISGTDDTAALQAAVDWQQAQPGRKLLGIPGATYLVTNSLVTDTGNDFRADWMGSRFFVNANAILFLAGNPNMRIAALTSDYTKDSTSLSVASTGTVLAPSQPFIVLSDAVAPWNRDNGDEASQRRVGEWAMAIKTGTTTTNIELAAPLERVIGVSTDDDSQGITSATSLIAGRTYTILTAGTTNFTLVGAANNNVGTVFTATGAGTGTGTVTSDEARVDAYTTALNARIVIPEYYNWEMVNFEIEYAAGHDSGSSDVWTAAAVLLYGVRGKVADFRIVRGYGPAIGLTGTHKFHVLGGQFDWLANDTSAGQFGYCVNDSGYGTIVIGCTFGDSRHGYDAGQGSFQVSANDETLLSAAGAQGFHVAFCTAEAQSDAYGLGTHHGATDGTFMDCKVYGCDTAFGIRGRGIRIVNPVVRRCKDRAVTIFADYNSGATNDRLLAGKEKRDYPSCAIINPDFECQGLAIEARNCVLEVHGHVRLRSASNMLLDLESAECVWGASVEMVTETMESAWALNGTNSTGVFTLTRVSDSNPSKLVFPETRLTILRGADISCDVSATDATTPYGVWCEDSTCVVVNKGVVYTKLPSDGVLFTAAGAITTEYTGQFRVELDGALDNANNHNLNGRDVNVQGEDGTVQWYARKPGLVSGLFKAYEDYTATTLTGTGSEDTGAVNFGNIGLNDTMDHLSTFAEGGSLELKVFALKGGATGTADLKFRSYGSDVETLQIPASTDKVDVTVRIVVSTANDYSLTFFWYAATNGAGSAGDTSVTQRVRSYAINLPGGIASASGAVLDLSPTIAVGDTLDIIATEAWVSGGGER